MALLRVRSHQNMVNNKISDHQDWRVIYPHMKYFYENVVRQKKNYSFIVLKRLDCSGGRCDHNQPTPSVMLLHVVKLYELLSILLSLIFNISTIRRLGIYLICKSKHYTAIIRFSSVTLFESLLLT